MEAKLKKNAKTSAYSKESGENSAYVIS